MHAEVVSAQGVINVETLLITFTENGDGQIRVSDLNELTGKGITTGDIVSFEYDNSIPSFARSASNIQKIIALVSALGTINMQLLIIDFTQGGIGEIAVSDPSELTGKNIVTSDDIEEVNIYTVAGEEIFSGLPDASGTISLANSPAGLYRLVVRKLDGSSSATSFIKE